MVRVSSSWTGWFEEKLVMEGVHNKTWWPKLHWWYSTTALHNRADPGKNKTARLQEDAGRVGLEINRPTTKVTRINAKNRGKWMDAVDKFKILGARRRHERSKELNSQKPEVLSSAALKKIWRPPVSQEKQSCYYTKQRCFQSCHPGLKPGGKTKEANQSICFKTTAYELKISAPKSFLEVLAWIHWVQN